MRPLAIKINGTDLAPEIPVIAVSVSLGVGRCGAAEVRIQQSRDDPPDAQIGQDLEIAFGAESSTAATTVFVGKVTRLGIEFDGRGNQLVIGALDKSLALARKTTLSSYLQRSLRDVISAIARDHGLTVDLDSGLARASTEHIQAAGTDQQMLDRITAALDCEWFVEGSKLKVIRRNLSRSAAVTYTAGTDLREFRANFTPVDTAKKVEVRRWDPDTKSVQTGVHQSTTADVGADPRVVIDEFTRGVDMWGSDPGVTIGAAVPGDVLLDDLAKGAAGRMSSTAMTAVGRVDANPDITPGVLVQLDEIGAAFSGKYFVTEVEHSMAGGDWVTRFSCGPKEAVSIPDLIGGGTVNSWDRLATSVAVGIVTNIEDPDNKNRVKVKLPVVSDEDETHWARVLQLGAGAGRGVAIMPEVDDEVLVAFEHGNLQNPYVLGGLWNGTDQAPTGTAITDGQVMHRSITSRVGHQFVMHDGDDPATKYVKVLLSDRVTTLLVGEDEVKVVSNGKKITVTDGRAELTMDGAGVVKLTGDTITVEADNALTLKSKQAAVTVQSATNLDIKAGTKLTAKGSAGAELDGGATTDVKGGMVNIN